MDASRDSTSLPARRRSWSTATASRSSFCAAKKGFKDAILMMDPANGNVVSLTLWETQADMDETGKPGGFVEKVLPLISPYQKTKPVFTMFKVRAQATRDA